MKSRAVFVIALCLASSLAAQTGGNAAIDGSLGLLGSSLAYQGRVGTYPSGHVRLSMATTSCNPGQVNLPWLPASDLRHPYIAFLIARLDPGAARLTQISHRSYLKHGFFALSNNQCSTCQCGSGGSGDWLGVGCSDTYSTSNNAGNLAPADDINPWTGVWTPNSQPTGGQSQCPRMTDADLTVAGASYYYCAQYVFPSWTQTSIGASCTSGGSPIPQPATAPTGFLCEPDANRENNLASRQMTISYSGGGTATFTTTGSQLQGSVLNRWTGATVTSNTNGNPVTGPSDGRIYVAVKVTQITNGRFHWEFAVHNRDNKGGVGVFRIPSCAGANVTNVGFHDVDVPADASNDWTFANTGTELTWTAPAGNSLRWNMLFNFWFDSDAGPVAGDATIDQATVVGGVNPSFTIPTTVPTGLFNVNLGPGCSSGGPLSLYTTGTPPRATLGNATFGLQCAGLGAGNTVDLYASFTPGTYGALSPCLVYLGPDLSTAQLFASTVASGFGVASYAASVPNDPGIEGLNVQVQCVEWAPGGALAGAVNLSNGLQIRVGNAVSSCP
jgi:hypothetical protein